VFLQRRMGVHCLFFSLVVFGIFCFYLETVYLFFSKIYKGPQIQSVCQPVAVEQCGFSWQKEYCEFHKRSLKSRDTSKYLSYTCSSTGHGGIGNRIQGIVSLFYLALLTNRTFFINWGGPGKLVDYLEPYQINWDLPLDSFGSFHKSYWGVSGPPGGYDDSIITSEVEFSKWSLEADFETKLPTRFEAIGTILHFVEELRKNPYLKRQAELKGLPSSPSKMLGCGFHFLFKKSNAMVGALKQAKLSLDRTPPLLGIHVRTSDHHWGSTNEFSYRSHNSTLFFLCAREQSKLIQEEVRPDQLTDVKWFLAVDDKDVKTAVKEQFSGEIITLDMVPQHLEFGWQNSETIRDVLLDMFLLAESDYLLLTFGSSFSRLVAAVGFHSDKSIADGEHCLVNKTSLITILAQ